MTSKPVDRRRRPRLSTMILCEIRIGEQEPELVRVRDMSECGLKVARSAPLTLGDRLRIRLPGASQWCLARVVWCSKGTAGLSFARAIDLPGMVGAHPVEGARRPDRFAQRVRVAG